MRRSPKLDQGSDPTDDRPLEALQAQAIAILQQEPQMERDRFALRLGLPFSTKRRGGSRLAHRGKTTIAALEQAGVIQLQAPTTLRESVMVCRPGYQPRRPGKGHETPCTSRFDPTLKGTWQPGDRPVRYELRSGKPTPIADIPLALTPKPPTPTEADMSRTKENLERALAAVAQAEEDAIAAGTYKLPSRNAIGLGLGLEDYFYGGTIGGKQATAAYNAAQTRLTLQRAAVETQNSKPSPTPVQSPLIANPYQLRLEEDNALLRAEIEALRQQMQQAPPVSRDTTLLQALKDEDRQLRGEADALLRQIDGLQRQHERLLTEANAIQRLIEQREGALEEAETAVAATNGHKALTAGVAR